MAKEKKLTKAQQKELEKKLELEKRAEASQKALVAWLKSNEEFHYNAEEAKYHEISTGSLGLDINLGKIPCGIHRFLGVPEGGKTSEALQIMFEGFDSLDNVKGVYIKAEGRLKPAMQERSGLKFVWTPEEWDDKSCYVFETNVFETALEFIERITNPENNPLGTTYVIVVDSMDGLIPKGDLHKDLSESQKIAGGAVITSVWCKKNSIQIGKRGHFVFLLSQVRAKVDATQGKGGGSKEPPRQISATGGNAAVHYADYIWEFQPRWKGDLIIENEKQPPNKDTNPIYGHYAKILVKKSPNECTNYAFEYPIKYGRTGGKSIWVEKEIVKLLLPWGFVTKAASWFTFTDYFFEVVGDVIEKVPEDASKADIEANKEENTLAQQWFPEKVQGEDEIFRQLEGRPELVKRFREYFITMMAGG